MFNVAPAHNDVAGFKSRRLGPQRLESDEVGDIAGRSLLHLQYHLGLDTLSWAQLGAAATGVDFSPRASDEELRLDTRFVCEDIYDLPDALRQHYDIDFTTYGSPMLSGSRHATMLELPTVSEHYDPSPADREVACAQVV